MKKIVSLLMLTFSVFFLVACSNKPSKEAMNEELKKPEVIAVIEKSLKKIDNGALTEEGKIKSYEINYDKTDYNSRGGIEIEIYINGNSNLKLNSLITKNRDEYKVSVSVQSKALVDFLEDRK